MAAGGLALDSDRSRVDDSNPTHRREPQLPVCSLQPRRLPAAVHLHARQAIARAEYHWGDGTAPSLGDVGQLAATDTGDATVRAHPEEAVGILQNLKDAIVMKTLVPGEPREPFIREAIQTAVISAYPENAVAVLVKRPYPASDEAIAARDRQ